MIEMNPERVRVEVGQDGLAVVRLVRAAAHNAIDLEMARSISAAAVAVERAAGVRAVLICADGPSFTVGGDLPHILEQRGRVDEHLDDMLTSYHDGLERLAKLPAPVVCAARGAVAGGGLGLLWCADLVFAADDLRIIGAFGMLGLSNDGGTSWWLPRLVGLRRAQELMLTPRRLDAAEALEWGLVTRVLPNAELDGEALRLARELASGPTIALAAQRRLLRESFDRTLRDQFEEEKRTIMACGATADGDEGITAFAERRPPRFEGR